MKSTAIASLLKKNKLKLVLAESCTGGLLSSVITEIPGISEYFCGSLVVYREASKVKWLGVRKTTLKKHSAVSEQCAREMALGALKNTPEAHVAISITGYLGPTGKNIGQVFMCAALKKSKKTMTQEFWILPPKPSQKRKLKKENLINARLQRRRIALDCAFFLVRSLL